MRYIEKWFLLVLVLLTGCQTATLVGPETPSIVLKEPQTRKSRLSTIQFPAGIYEADFKTVEGTYYRSTKNLVSTALGMNQVLRGGIFIPSPSSHDQRQGAWADNQEGSGGLIGFAASSPKRVFRFKDPLPIETQPLKTAEKQ